MHPNYPNLLSPIKIGNVILKSHLCLAPMALREIVLNGWRLYPEGNRFQRKFLKDAYHIDEGICVRSKGKDDVPFPADSVISSIDIKVRTALVDELQKATATEFYAIGDYTTAWNLSDTTRVGYCAAINVRAISAPKSYA